MLKYFSFGIVLTTLFKVSVVTSRYHENVIQAHDHESPSGLEEHEAKTVRDEVLSESNFYRSMHGLQSFILDENLTYHAQEWANVLAAMGSLERRTVDNNGIYAENLYSSQTFTNIGKKAVKSWYNQLRFVNEYDNDELLTSKNDSIDEMKNLLWKPFYQIGVGVAKSDNGTYYIVTNYNVKGDLFSTVTDNLPELRKEDIDAAELSHATSDPNI